MILGSTAAHMLGNIPSISGIKFFKYGHYSLATSTNGTTWTTSSMTPPTGSVAVYYWGNVNTGGVFRAESGGGIDSSPNGITWTNNTGFPCPDPVAVYVPQYTIHIGGNSPSPYNLSEFDYQYSTDGLSWTQSNLPDRSAIPGSGVTFLSRSVDGYNSKFVSALSMNVSFDKCCVSTNGTSWTMKSLPSSQFLQKVRVLNNQIFVFYGTSNYWFSSNQGTSWSSGSLTNISTSLDTGFSNGIYYANNYAGTTIYVSTDAVTWNAYTRPSNVKFVLTDQLRTYFFGIDSTYTTLSVSSDAINWTVLSTSIPSVSGTVEGFIIL